VGASHADDYWRNQWYNRMAQNHCCKRDAFNTDLNAIQLPGENFESGAIPFVRTGIIIGAS